MKKLSVSYKLGFNAGISGKVKIIANIYNRFPNTKEYFDWKEGYKAGHLKRQILK